MGRNSINFCIDCGDPVTIEEVQRPYADRTIGTSQNLDKVARKIVAYEIEVVIIRVCSGHTLGEFVRYLFES